MSEAGEAWRVLKLAELAANTRNAIVGGPSGSDLVSADYTESGVPVIRGQNVGGERWVSGDFAFVSQEKADSLGTNLARPGDIVFTQRGTLGQVAIVPDSPWERYVISQSQMKATVNPSLADPHFVYYYFTNPAEQQFIVANASQTGVPHSNLGQLRAHPMRIPSLREQRAIAGVLGALDDKIEQNQRTARALERLARAIFRAWFVDFEPVKAKAAGATAFPSMPQPVFDALPTRFVDSDIGPVPGPCCATRTRRSAPLRRSRGSSTSRSICAALGATDKNLA
jgi:type I restriction enzyme, S subunit